MHNTWANMYAHVYVGQCITTARHGMTWHDNVAGTDASLQHHNQYSVHVASMKSSSSQLSTRCQVSPSLGSRCRSLAAGRWPLDTGQWTHESLWLLQPLLGRLSRNAIHIAEVHTMAEKQTCGMHARNSPAAHRAHRGPSHHGFRSVLRHA